MQDYVAEDWRTILQNGHLRSFDDFWRLKADWFEQPNHRRGGWSGVARCELKAPDGGVRRIFVKRQENHVSRTWRHPIRGMATLVREFRNFQRFERSHLPTARVVYFGHRCIEGNLRAVLVTEELTGYRSLQDLTVEWSRHGWPPLARRQRMIEAIAGAIRQMHDHHLRHHCLWPKHIFLKESKGGPVEVRIIDLEKTRWTPFRKFAARGDLSSLDRDSRGWSTTDRVRFYKAYLRVDRLRDSQSLWRAVVERNQAKIRGRLQRNAKERV
jgi:hypothetical protein